METISVSSKIFFSNLEVMEGWLYLLNFKTWVQAKEKVWNNLSMNLFQKSLPIFLNVVFNLHFMLCRSFPYFIIIQQNSFSFTERANISFLINPMFIYWIYILHFLLFYTYTQFIWRNMWGMIFSLWLHFKQVFNHFFSVSKL